ncbi:MAG: DNA-3-methyladenine glycosylase [Kiritimatiellae bacterium]|nr:DNA-3-methyladenine glycosylase [Kiritimatiellia bacterium]MDD5521489.1 DNA-3-methyladenine glycosylase [Kiritimatiellia bacterium]
MPKIKQSFFTRPDVIQISRELLGKYLFTKIGKSIITGGMIVETEAYAGPEDRASHAHGNRRTKRTEPMFHRGGIAYVYLCYGMYPLFNIVTNVENIPHAILVRAIQPTYGTAVILKRRNKTKLDRSVAGGPGALCKALGINLGHNGEKLTGRNIWLEDRDCILKTSQIVASPRVGVDYAGSHAKRPWRFRIKNNPWTSKPD